MKFGAIVIPTYNEADNVVATLKRLESLCARWLVIVSDGGSTDGTQDKVRMFDCLLVESGKGRALQLNQGALKARELLSDSGVLVFLHADTLLPDGFENHMQRFIHQRNCSGEKWGRFDVRLSGRHNALRLIEFMMNQRSRLTGVATDDQVMFFDNTFFWQLDGFPELPLMEDVAMSRRAKRLARPYAIDDPVITSSRKWEREGIWRTVVLMWICRGAFFVGVRPATIHQWYYKPKSRRR